MPNIINYLYRLWCKKCSDFTLHEKVYIDEYDHKFYSKINFNDDVLNDKGQCICSCGTQHEPVPLTEIPKKQIEKQRYRFNEYRKKDFGEMTQTMIGHAAPQNILEEMMRPVQGPKTKIIESDAGLEEEEILIRQKQKEQKEALRQELNRFKHIGRNDVCLCGSGLKYKKCCLQKHN